MSVKDRETRRRGAFLLLSLSTTLPSRSALLLRVSVLTVAVFIAVIFNDDVPCGVVGYSYSYSYAYSTNPRLLSRNAPSKTTTRATTKATTRATTRTNTKSATFTKNRRIISPSFSFSSSSSSTALHSVPLSSFTDPSHRTFLSSSESYRICIDSNGHLRSDADVDVDANANANADDNSDNSRNNSSNYKSKNSSCNNYYTISIAEEDDLPQIATFVIDAFGGADVITLSNEFQSSLQSNPIERALVQPGINLWNNYANAVAFTDVLSGLRQRIKHRKRRIVGNGSDSGSNSASNDFDYMIEAPPFAMGVDVDVDVGVGDDAFSQEDMDDIAAKSSVIFVLAKTSSNRSSNSGDCIETVNDIIASVELRLQPTDAKIPFSQPWFDKIERKLAQQFQFRSDTSDSNNNNNNNDNDKINTKLLQPYLSNLCVDNSVRGRGLGKVLCRIVERTVQDSWKFDKIYLHVDLDNIPALNLYKSEGYVDVGARWNPFWAGRASEIGYFVKNL